MVVSDEKHYYYHYNTKVPTCANIVFHNCRQCFHFGKVFSTLGELLGLDSFLVPTDSFEDNITELSLLGDIYDFEVFYCNNSNKALSNHKEPSHKRNIWSYNNTYLSHENILEFMFTQTKKYVG